MFERGSSDEIWRAAAPVIQLLDDLGVEYHVGGSVARFATGHHVSDRQWYDVVGVLKVQGDNADIDYLRTWAVDQGVSDLLEKALSEAGISS